MEGVILGNEGKFSMWGLLDVYFFSYVGASILNQVYKKKAYPMAGSAFYRLHSESDAILAYSSVEDGYISSDENAFHCWVMCDGYVIDFMSPIFREAMKDAGINLSIERKMFQRSLEAMSPDYDQLSKKGDFFYEPNPDLTQHLFHNLDQKPANADLVKVCHYWFKRPPKKIKKSFLITDDLGEVTKLNLKDHGITGMW